MILFATRFPDYRKFNKKNNPYGWKINKNNSDLKNVLRTPCFCENFK